MKSWYFTFGVGVNDPHRNCYTIIRAHNYEEARNKMFDKFGDKWAFQYSESEWFSKPGDKTYNGDCYALGFNPATYKKPISQAELYSINFINN